MPSYPDTYPPERSHRTLVLCFDGTDNKISTMHSNVAQFFSLLKKDRPSDQLVYYQTGIGTYTSSNIMDPISSKIAKTMDSMFAVGIATHVKDGYTFLMQHYLDGDKICIFGFSRGAYTARALAGMVHKVGLLPRGNIRHIKSAYKVFMKASEHGWKQAAEFKRSFCIDVEIEFVGIWDSVGSVGLNSPGLPFSNASTTIKRFRHALALDERRALFQANAWRCYEHFLSSDPDPRTRSVQHNRKSISKILKRQARYSTRNPGSHTDVLEVWFAGCHSDVGGSAVPNDTPHSLSRISLRWMVRECFLARTGIMFSPDALREIGLDPTGGYPLVSELEEREDALSPIHDQLRLAPLWWILEFLPFQRWIGGGGSDDEDKNIKSFSWNLGRPRIITHQGSSASVMVHNSVQVRMEDPDLKYIPKARLGAEPRWVQ